jgi:hypothetical protein
MTLLPTGSASNAEPADTAEPSQEPVSTPVPGPVLITEQQVLLGSAAAMGLRAEPAPRRWDLLSRVFGRQAREDRWKVRKTATQHWYLEDARMHREMDHL